MDHCSKKFVSNPAQCVHVERKCMWNNKTVTPVLLFHMHFPYTCAQYFSTQRLGLGMSMRKCGTILHVEQYCSGGHCFIVPHRCACAHVEQYCMCNEKVVTQGSLFRGLAIPNKHNY